MKKNKQIAKQNTFTEFLLYTAPSGKVKVEIFLRDENLWLTQAKIAELFGVERSVVTKHLQNIFQEGELDKKSTCAKIAQVQKEGRRQVARNVEFYDLDAIISVGYRVNSRQATHFRIWATQVLKDRKKGQAALIREGGGSMENNTVKPVRAVGGMNKRMILTALIALVFLAPAAGRAEDNKSGMTREQAEGFAKDISLVSRQAVLPAVHAAVNNSAAAYWALWDLVNDLSARQKAGGKPEPDPELVETNIRLRMRGDHGKLCSKFSGTCKEYPGDKEFSKATLFACKDIGAYAAGFRTAQNFAEKRHLAKIERLLENARDRAMFSLRPTRETSVQAPPPTAGEERYIQLSLQKKEGDKFTFPPWP